MSGRTPFDEILQGLGVACYAVDAALRLRWASARAIEYWRRDWAAIAGLPLDQVFPSIAGTPQYHALLAALRHGRAAKLDALSPIFDRWMSFDIRPSPEGAVITFQDIHDRKVAEDALKESEARFRDIAANFPGIIYRRVMHPDGRIEYPFMSDSVAKVLGASMAQVKEINSLQQFAAYTEPEDMARWQAMIRRSAETLEPTDFVIRMNSPDGKRRYIRSLASPHRRADGAVVWDGVNLDVTEQKEIEERFRERDEMLQAAIAGAELGTWEVDATKGTTRWSARMTEMLGLRPEDAQAPRRARHERVHPDDRERLVAAFAAHVEKGAPYHVEFRWVRPDGGVQWVASYGNTLRDADGKPIRIVGVVQDITARKAAEERQLLLMAELDHRVKNILAIVQALARRSLAGPEGPKVFSERLAALARTHGLLSQHRWKGVGLAVLVRQALAPYAGARLEARGPDLLLQPRAAQSLSLVFHELATNAAKYGALSAQRGQVSVAWRTLQGEKASMQLLWTETGGPPTVEPGRRGFGSQLVERTMVHELQGGAVFDFRPEGLQVTLSLPLAGLAAGAGVEPAATEPTPPAAGANLLAGKRVLVVEDMALVAHELSEALQEAGLAVVGPAARLEEAIRMALAEPVDAAVLDVNLDGEYVWPLATLLRQRRVPTLLVTGYDGHSLPAAMEGMPRLSKPVDFDALKAWLSESLAPDRPGS